MVILVPSKGCWMSGRWACVRVVKRRGARRICFYCVSRVFGDGWEAYGEKVW